VSSFPASTSRPPPLAASFPARKSPMHDALRALAPKAYGIHGLGGATTFSAAWPAIGNYLVWQGSSTNASGTSKRIQTLDSGWMTRWRL
jgi:hypothetical protein